jgi:hypothetical protein
MERMVLNDSNFWKGFAVSSLLLAALGGGGWIWQTQRAPFDFFWAPVLNSTDPVLFCIADQNEYSNIALFDAADPSRQIILKDNLTAVVWDDLNSIVNFAGLLQANGKKYSLKGEATTNLTDLRGGPTIFIGAFDNAWTLRQTKPLRYHFVNDAQMLQLGIVDSDNPAWGGWMIDRLQQASNNFRDYTIAARFTDSTTGKLSIIAAGVGSGGTIAAGRFLTDPNSLTALMRAAGNKKNMEVVLSTQINNGEPGGPKIEATYFW